MSSLIISGISFTVAQTSYWLNKKVSALHTNNPKSQTLIQSITYNALEALSFVGCAIGSAAFVVSFSTSFYFNAIAGTYFVAKHISIPGAVAVGTLSIIPSVTSSIWIIVKRFD